MAVLTTQCYRDCNPNEKHLSIGVVVQACPIPYPPFMCGRIPYPHNRLIPSLVMVTFATPELDFVVSGDHELNISYHVAYLLGENRGKRRRVPSSSSW